MPRLILFLTLFLTGTTAALSQDATDGDIVIEGVTVIDVVTGERIENQSVSINGTRISSIIPTRGASSEAARVIDGSGKFLIPGLWEMHAHAFEHYGIDYDYSMVMYKLFIANGVTGVRDMGSYLGQMLAGKRRIASQNLVAPRIVASGPFLETGDSRRFGPEFLVNSPDEARAAVDSLVAAGVDFVKIHSGMTRDIYMAAAEQAKLNNITFAGHIPVDMNVIEVSDAGQRSIEHLYPFGSVCRLDNPRGRGLSETPIPIDYDGCQAAIDHLARNGTFVAPTIIFTAPLDVDHPRVSRDLLKYMKPSKQEKYRPPPVYTTPDFSNVHDYENELARMLVDGGVTILAGTDTGSFYRQPGFALHEELELMVTAGISPLVALQSATLNPAIYFDRRSDLGTVEPGKLADLVLLEGDPLEDISNTRRISAVIANGELFDADAINKLLQDIESAAQGFPVVR